MSNKSLTAAKYILIIAFIFTSKFCFCQTYKATYESNTFKGKVNMGIVNLDISENFIAISYGINNPFYKNFPIISRINQHYILARDNQARTSDLWIFQSKYKIVRIWSNQKNDSFGRITYSLVR